MLQAGSINPLLPRYGYSCSQIGLLCLTSGGKGLSSLDHIQVNFQLRDCSELGVVVLALFLYVGYFMQVTDLSFLLYSYSNFREFSNDQNGV